MHHSAKCRVAVAGVVLHQPIEQLGGESLQSVRSVVGGQRRVEIVEDVVRTPGEAVQRVHSGTLMRRKQSSCEKKRAAVLGIERAAAAIRVT